MFKKFLLIAAVVVLAGCKSGGGSGDMGVSGFTALPGSGTEIGSLPGTGGSPYVPEPSDEDIQRRHSPEPTTMVLFGIGLSSLVASKLRKKKR